MNREILFKAKRNDNGEWIEGDLIHWYNKDDNEKLNCCIIPKKDSIANKSIKDFIVISETVSQYTGLKDKNGAKIFENDIVKARYEENNGYIRWNGGNASFQIKGIPSHTLKRADELEVIGNMFDEEVK